MTEPGNEKRNLYSRRWFLMMGPFGFKPFPGSLIHSPCYTSSIVYEPNLEFQLRGKPTSAAYVEGDPKHRRE